MRKQRAEQNEAARESMRLLAAEVIKARTVKGWSQQELSSRSRVSEKTISDVEQAREGKQFRTRVISDLATTLGADATRWVKLAGYDVSAQTLSSMGEHARRRQRREKLIQERRLQILCRVAKTRLEQLSPDQRLAKYEEILADVIDFLEKL